VAGDFTRDGGYAGMLELAERMPEVTAVFALNDPTAVGVMAALRDELGRRVPEEISVMGFDDIPAALDVTPTLTTVRLPLEEMGERAMRLLLDDPDRPPRTVRVKAEVVSRGSTAPPPDRSAVVAVVAGRCRWPLSLAVVAGRAVALAGRWPPPAGRWRPLTVVGRRGWHTSSGSGARRLAWQTWTWHTSSGGGARCLGVADVVWRGTQHPGAAHRAWTWHTSKNACVVSAVGVWRSRLVCEPRRVRGNHARCGQLADAAGTRPLRLAHGVWMPHTS